MQSLLRLFFAKRDYDGIRSLDKMQQLKCSVREWDIFFMLQSISNLIGKGNIRARIFRKKNTTKSLILAQDER